MASATESPPPKPRKDRVAATKAMLQGAIDPISAMIVPAAPKASLKTVCNRTIKVSDARNVFTLVLSPLKSDRLRSGARTHTCAVRYKPLGGHRASSKSVKRFARNRTLRMTFAPLTPSVWGVVGFSLKSRYGRVRGSASTIRSS